MGEWGMWEALFASGRMIDLIIVLLLSEGLAIAWMHHRTGFGLPWRAVAPMIASGVLLLLAVRLALTGWGWQWIAVCLGLAGVAHFFDLLMRRQDRSLD